MPHLDFAYIPGALTVIFLIASVITAFSSPVGDGHIDAWSNGAFRWSFRLFIVSITFLALILLARAGVPNEFPDGVLPYIVCILVIILAILLPITTFGNWVVQWAFRLFILMLAFWVLALLTREGTPLGAFENFIRIALGILVLQLQYRIGRLQKELASARSNTTAKPP